MVTGPLDGLLQLMVSGWPAVAWIPAGGLLMTLLVLPCAATIAAKERTSGIQGRMLFAIVLSRFSRRMVFYYLKRIILIMNDRVYANSDELDELDGRRSRKSYIQGKQGDEPNRGLTQIEGRERTNE